MVPFPLYTCVHVKKNVSALKFSGENTAYAVVRLRCRCTTKHRSIKSFHTLPFKQSLSQELGFEDKIYVIFAVRLRSHCGKIADLTAIRMNSY